MTKQTSIHQLDYQTLIKYLPKRAIDAHKGLFGHVLVIGGDYGFAGAPRMAGEAALRVGAGLVSVITRPEHINTITSSRPELMAYGLDHLNILETLLTRVHVIAIGPGLGQTEWSKQLLERVVDINLPMVLDADALNLLPAVKKTPQQFILTPHAGEAARLLSRTTAEVQSDRTKAILQLQSQYGGTIVLKGKDTLVCDANKKLSLCPYGNPGMATAGMGDILTGVIAGLIGQGLNITQAAELGVCLHGLAGDKASLQGERGLLATDLLSPLRTLANAIEH